MTKTLAQLFVDFPFPRPADIPDVPITGIAIDSRAVKPGNLFVAMKGGTVDGHGYIGKAIANGAAAVIGELPAAQFDAPRYVRLDDPRRALTWLAAAFYGWPARRLTVIGVTGTDGKTTTANLLYQILRTAGIQAGMVSTVNAVIGDEILDTGFHVTTPDAHDVQAYLAKMADAGARLFESLEKTGPKERGNPRLAVINRDDQSFYFLNELIKGRKLSYGLHESADVRAENARYSSTGIRFFVDARNLHVEVKSDLIGAYNVSNCLAAFTGAVYGLGIDPQIAAQGMTSLHGIPGRMERIDLGQPFTAIVDFAHTPNALKSALEAAREMLKEERESRGRVIVTFGSAGLRDKEKRRMMAETSAELADLTVLTAEDPRTESLEGILEEMAAGARSRRGRDGETFWRVADRGEAIRFAVRMARPGDIVLACGKGHEQSMCFGATEYPWDDRTAMRAALSELLGVDGPKMPYLPTQDKPESEWMG
ncbi:UDP-N-acetylmuramoyl-L-alanyl-D-glutamate--2,6-diaminopimelate ligase [Anaerolineae bacterium AMX1]|nr:UDP-N-acetylmuramoyl-L-alanyl-D-glutamate--2,6-diaminopimelate ligase [Anaerolineae bacterium AMX1]